MPSESHTESVAAARAFIGSEHRLYIGGEFVKSSHLMDVVDPSTGEVQASVPLADHDLIERAVEAATSAREPYRRTSPAQKAKWMWALAAKIEEHLDEFAAIEVLDNGKPFWEAQVVDIALTAEIFRYFAGCASTLEGSIPTNGVPGMLSLLQIEPIGVVAALTPWNFPLLETAYKLGPALAAGCPVVLKPSELAPLSTLRLMQLIDEVGFPPGVVNVVIGGPEVGQALIVHPHVQKVAFTGQTATGRQILHSAANSLKPVTLELGGKSPNIVFADANLDAATAGVFGGVFFNQGQACVAGSRLLAHSSISDQLVETLLGQAATIRLGSGLDPSTQMGPLISATHRERVLGFVTDAVSQGATVAVGGAAADVEGLAGGYFVQPTVLSGVKSTMNVAQEEVFGPVLAVMTWDDEDELVQLANDVPYGIAAGIWTSNTARALVLSARLDVGTVWINTYGVFDVAVPFGGRKQSGGGRELGKEALRPYLVNKSVWLDLAAQTVAAGQAVGR
ncbi:MAG: aldehyde dehydrogenase family protein [Acidimicrobiales bacterium]